MLRIESAGSNYGIAFPQRVFEIPPHVLVKATEHIKLAKHYCIVALCFKTKLFDFVIRANNNKDLSVGVTPLLAKVNGDCVGSIGDKVIIDRTNLERAIHLYSDISITTAKAKEYINSDPDLVKSIVTKANKDLDGQSIILMEFKIVPIADITAFKTYYPEYDPFLYVQGENQVEGDKDVHEKTAKRRTDKVDSHALNPSTGERN